MRKIPAAILASALICGCATTAGGDADIPEAGAGPCDSEAAQGLVGSQATSDLGAEAMRLSGARALRWIPPDSAVTMDYRPGRLNIEYDREMQVSEIRCG